MFSRVQPYVYPFDESVNSDRAPTGRANVGTRQQNSSLRAPRRNTTTTLCEPFWGRKCAHSRSGVAVHTGDGLGGNAHTHTHMHSCTRFTHITAPAQAHLTHAHITHAHITHAHIDIAARTHISRTCFTHTFHTHIAQSTHTHAHGCTH